MKILIISFIAFVVSTNLFAFEKNDSTEVNGDILKKKPIAFQFAIGSMLTLTNFNNLNISAKKHFSENLGLRLGVGFNTSKEDLSETQPTLTTNDEKSNNFNNRISVALDLIYYISPYDEVKAYGGFGPYFNYFENSFKRTRDLTTTSPYYYYDYNRTVSIGANALLGVEWFASRKFSIFAEYNFAFTYSWIRSISDYYTQGNSSFQDLSGNETELSGRQLKFGLSVYF